jgi:hypothetical protein
VLATCKEDWQKRGLSGNNCNVKKERMVKEQEEGE